MSLVLPKFGVSQHLALVLYFNIIIL